MYVVNLPDTSSPLIIQFLNYLLFYAFEYASILKAIKYNLFIKSFNCFSENNGQPTKHVPKNFETTQKQSGIERNVI